jgi:hypothetical protein
MWSFPKPLPINLQWLSCVASAGITPSTWLSLPLTVRIAWIRIFETRRTDQLALRLSGLSHLPQALFHLALGRVGL